MKQKYEHKFVAGRLLTWFREIGNLETDGWEAVCITEDKGGDYTCILKRPHVEPEY